MIIFIGFNIIDELTKVMEWLYLKIEILDKNLDAAKYLIKYYSGRLK